MLTPPSLGKQAITILPSACVQEHTQPDADIVFVEYAINDLPRSRNVPLDHYER